MDEHLIDELRSLPGEPPDKAFRRRMLLEIDLAADEYEDASSLERSAGASAEKGRSARRGRFPLLVAAATLAIVAVAWQLLRDGGDEDLEAGAFDVAAVLEAAAAPGLADGERLGFLVEAAGVEPSPEVLASLGAELRDQGLLRIAARPFDGISDFSLSPDGTTVVVVSDASAGREASVWSVVEDDAVEIAIGDDPLFAAGFLSTGQVRVTSERLQISVVDLSAPTVVVPDVPLATNRLDVAPAVGRLDRELVAFDPESGEVLGRVDVPRVVSLPVRVAPEGALVVASRQRSAEEPAGLIVWDPASPSVEVDHPLLDIPVADSDAVAFSPDGRFVAVALSDRVAVLDGTSFRELRSIAVAGASRLDFVGAGSTLVVQDALRFSVWDAADAAQLLDDVPTGEPETLSATDPASRVAPIAGRVIVLSSSVADVAEVWLVDPQRWVDVACGEAVPLPESDRARLGFGSRPSVCEG